MLDAIEYEYGSDDESHQKIQRRKGKSEKSEQGDKNIAEAKLKRQRKKSKRSNWS